MRNSVLVCLVIPFFALGNSVWAQETPPAVLRIVAPSQPVHATDVIKIEIALENTSLDAYYVCGSIRVGRDDAVCNYDLQIRRAGADIYETTPKGALDPPFRAYGRAPSPLEFKSSKNMFLLEPRQIIGRTLSGTWTGIAVRSSGKYDVRVVYSGTDRLPVTLDKPFLSGRIVSNVVQIEILP
jgi:hypothetical protein